MMSSRASASLLALVTAVALSTASCAGGASGDPTAGEGGTDPGAPGTGTGTGGAGVGGLTVGAADFPDSPLIGAIYAAALEAHGIEVRERLGIRAREAYLSALKDGSVDIVPERIGALALYYDQNAELGSSKAVYHRLKKLIPARLAVLQPSAAEDKDSISVTRATAQKLHLSSIADLRGKAGDLTLGAPPAFQQRPQGAPGLQNGYGVVFGSFRPLTGAALSKALKNGQVDAANLFTTDPSIGLDHFVVLKDPKGLFGVQNVVPLIVKSEVTPTVKQALNAVSAKLDTRALTKLNKAVQVDHQDVDTVAQQFLEANGLDEAG